MFIHMGRNLSFWGQNNIPLYVCAHCWALRSFVDLDCFPTKPVINGGAVSTGIEIAALRMHFQFFWAYTEMELLDPVSILFLIFE